jgi:hypothetical protein
MDRRIKGLFAPRHLESVLVGADARGVHVTWMLGESVSADAVEFFTYGVVVTGSRGGVIRRFGVKFVGTEDPEVFPFVNDFVGVVQANYSPEQLRFERGSVSVYFVDSDMGSEPVDTAVAYLDVNGHDVESSSPVTIVDAP